MAAGYSYGHLTDCPFCKVRCELEDSPDHKCLSAHFAPFTGEKCFFLTHTDPPAGCGHFCKRFSQSLHKTLNDIAQNKKKRVTEKRLDNFPAWRFVVDTRRPALSGADHDA